MTDYEIIRYKQGMNARILMHSISRYRLHWHPEIEILLVLEGSITVHVNGASYVLNEGELFILNPGDVHSTVGDGKNIIAALQIRPAFCEQTFPELKNLEFLWPSEIKPESYRQIRYIIAMMIEEYRLAVNGYAAAIEGMLYGLLVHLVRSVPSRTREAALQDQRHKDLERIRRITTFIREHYMQKLSLDELARREYLSPYYLSHFFKEKIGITFQEYVKNIRLHHAVRQLADSSKSVEDIALGCGFASAKAFSKSFRESYDITPGEYRRLQNPNLDDIDVSGMAAYMEYDSIQAMHKVRQFLQYETPAYRSAAPVGARAAPLSVQAAAPAQGLLFQSWKRLGSVGRAYDILRADVQRHLRLAKKELHIELLRFHGIFSEEMRICTRAPDGSLAFNWRYADTMLDFLMETGIRPIFDLTFMPEALKSRDVYMFWYRGNISPPAKMEEWGQLVAAFATHLVHRYGLAEVRQWYFEVWNEPDYMTFSGDVALYLEFMLTTQRALEKAGSGLRLAGPSVLHPISLQAAWTDSLLAMAQKSGLRLNCFTYHIYGENDMRITQTGGILPTMGGKRHVVDCMNIFQEQIARLPGGPVEAFITEFNASGDHKNYLLDTMFPACHILYNYLAGHQKVNGIAYWTLTDIFEEDPALKPPFSGGFGLITAEGIRKPAWWALYFLEQLGEEILAQDEEYILTRQGETYHLLCFNYPFYDKTFRDGDRSLLTFQDRYSVFESRPPLLRTIRLEGLTGPYELRCETLSRTHGSAFDEYLRMGAPSQLSQSDMEYLTAQSRPRVSVQSLALTGSLEGEVKLRPHEIKLYTLKPFQ